MTPPAGQRWTREKPTVAGWYWWRLDDGQMQVVYVSAGGTVSISGVGKRSLKRLDGEWLGPLSPTDRQQGRVASCEWTYDDMDDYYETACKRGYSLEDGTLEENYHKYCPYCGGLIQLAQAQDEKGVGE